MRGLENVAKNDSVQNLVVVDGHPPVDHVAEAVDRVGVAHGVARSGVRHEADLKKEKKAWFSRSTKWTDDVTSQCEFIFSGDCKTTRTEPGLVQGLRRDF